MSEMLPEIGGMRMFAGGATAPPPETEIAFPRTREPGMGCKDAAPVLPKLDIDGRDLAQTFRQRVAGDLRGAADHMVVAAKDGDSRCGGLLDQPLCALEPRPAQGLFDQYRLRPFRDRGARQRDMTVRGGTDTDQIVAALRRFAGFEQADGLVPLTVSARIDLPPCTLQCVAIHVA